MVIPTLAAIKVQCPTCGREEEYKVSLFLFNNYHAVRITCGNCGTRLLSLSARDRRRFELSLTCPRCEEAHLLPLERGQLWGVKGSCWRCPDCGVEIGGSKSLVGIQEGGAVGVLAAGGSYFVHRPAMFTALERLCQMVRAGNVYCQCGNHDLEVEVFSDRIGFYCELCGAWGWIAACSDDDRFTFSQIEEIQLVNQTREVESTVGEDYHPPHSRKRKNLK